MSTVDLSVDDVRTWAPVRGSDYAELTRLVRRAGLLDRRPVFYAVHIAVGPLMLAEQ
ncbi:hypothetical protein WEI85_06500 [Actinomycetes bacterium KLBMP 9797]